MYCVQCGYRIDPAVQRYCVSCGHAVLPPPTAPALDRNGFKAHLFRAIGILITAIATAVALWTVVFLHGAIVADGVVSSDEFGNGSHIGITFTTASGEQRSFSQNGFIFGHYKGQRVRVLYHPEDPSSEACLDSFDAIWGVPVVLFTLGSVFFFVGRHLLRVESPRAAG